VRHIRLRLRIQGSAYLCSSVMVAALAMGCAEKDPDADASAATDPETADVYDGPPVSFEEALTEVLVPSCGFNSCHGSGAGYLRIHERQTEEEWIDLNSNVLMSRRMVVPGNAANSYLIKKMEGSIDIEGEAMPPPDGGLSGYRIGMVRSWIDNIESTDDE
jgi:hypothetical protein